MTDSEIIEYLYLQHQELWYWLATSGSHMKSHWPGWDKIKRGLTLELCFACCFDTFPVETCLLSWPGDLYATASECLGCRGLYHKWGSEPEGIRRKLYAFCIRDLDLSEQAKQVLLGNKKLINKNLRGLLKNV